MTRALVLAALLAVPAVRAVAADPVPPPGTIVFTEGTNDLVRGRWISLAECQDTAARVSLSWTAQLAAAVAFPSGATYQVYASNQPVTGTACHMASNASTGLVAGSVGAAIAGEGQAVAMWPFAISDLLAAAGLADCASVSADTPLYVCAQAYGPDATPVGIATGTMTLSIAAPAPPANLSAAPWDDGALQVSWTAPAGTPSAYDYRLVLTADADPVAHELIATQATSAVLTGLLNDVSYRIRVYARSQAGNESAPAETTGTPMRYALGVIPTPPGGSDGSGCASGGAGPLALLGAAALLARRRQRGTRPTAR